MTTSSVDPNRLLLTGDPSELDGRRADHNRRQLLAYPLLSRRAWPRPLPPERADGRPSQSLHR